MLAIDCLTDLLRDGALTLEQFGTTTHELRRSRSKRLFDVIIRWFQSASFPLFAAANDLVRRFRDMKCIPQLLNA
jgi:hypothetical protein